MTEREFSIAEISIKQASRFELIEILTRAGGSGIGLWEYNNSPSRSDVGDVTSSGLRVTSYVPNENSVFPTAMSANKDDPLHRAGALRGSLERAAEYGAECVVILTGPILNESVEAMDILHRAIHVIAREASVLGVSLALEPIHASCARDFSAVSTLDQANRLLEVCETPEVGLALDDSEAIIGADLPSDDEQLGALLDRDGGGLRSGERVDREGREPRRSTRRHRRRPAGDRSST
jgi:sugar phosphate isomerase/epimerase